MSTVTLFRGPSPVTVTAAQVRNSATEFWRARVVVLFSLLIPVIWLVMIGAVAGSDVIDTASGLRVMQFATPTALTMGALYATLPTMAITLAQARETGVLKRLRGTPLPSWAYLTGRMLGATAFAVLSVAVALGLAVLAYDVQIVWRTVPATIVTLLLAIICFLALGLGLSVLCRSTAVAQGVSIGGVVVLSFISGLFTIGGTLPDAVTRVAEILPVKPLTDALQDQFNPYLSGAGWDLTVLGVLLAWTVVGAAVAAWGLRVQEGDVASHRRGERAVSRIPAHPASSPARALGASVTTATSGASAMTRAQAGAALRVMWRDPGSVFFAVIMPLGLFALVAAASPDAAGVAGGVPFVVHLAAGMIAWGAAVTTFMNIPETVVQARDRGVLKRLRGTPLAPAHYVAGRVLAGIVLAVVIAALVLGLGVAVYDVQLPVTGLFMASGLLVLGAVTLAACGFLLAAVVTSARAFGAVAFVVLLPLAFVSDVFSVGGPDWIGTVGSVFPLKHLQNALAEVLAGVATTGTWWHVAILAAWALVAGALALRLFRWHVKEPG